MEQRKILRLGSVCLLFAVVLRLSAMGVFRTMAQAVCNEKLVSLLFYTQTGMIFREFPGENLSETENTTSPTERTQPTEPSETEPDAVISFSPEDLELVGVNCYCSYDPDLSELLQKPLDMHLASTAPTVLIIHTHGSESYTGDYTPVEPYRTLDNTLNMIAIGDRVAEVLEENGISVLHDRNIYDYPDYNGAYSAARKSIQQYLADYPTIQMVLDLHRDASDGDAGQFATKATVNGRSAAQIMFVVGTDDSGLHHPNWQENLALALKLDVCMEQKNPGVTRSISLRSKRFNMDLTTGSLLVEVGAAGNTLQEAMLAAEAFAEAVVTLCR